MCELRLRATLMACGCADSGDRRRRTGWASCSSSPRSASRCSRPGSTPRSPTTSSRRSAGSSARTAAPSRRCCRSASSSESSDKVTLNGEFNVRFFKVKLEGGVEYVRQLRANGQVAITVKLPTSGGVGPPLAKELKVGASSTARSRPARRRRSRSSCPAPRRRTSSSSRSPTRRSRSRPARSARGSSARRSTSTSRPWSRSRTS